jgi:hypothetical protein
MDNTACQQVDARPTDLDARINRLNTNRGRLRMLCGEIESVADRLYGPTPVSGEAGPTDAPANGSMAMLDDELSILEGDIERLAMAVGRIQEL